MAPPRNSKRLRDLVTPMFSKNPAAGDSVLIVLNMSAVQHTVKLNLAWQQGQFPKKAAIGSRQRECRTSRTFFDSAFPRPDRRS